MKELFVCSLTEERDSLPQWKFYGSSALSFSMGFSSEFLYDITKRTDYRHISLLPCIYDKEKQLVLIEQLIRSIVLMARLYGNNYMGFHYAFDQEVVEFVASMIKHPKFAHEKEWRLVVRNITPNGRNSYLTGYNDLSHGFKATADALIPYCKINLYEENEKFERQPINWPKILKTIVIGPNEDMMLCWATLARYAELKKLGHIGIGFSEIPFRAK